MLQVFTSIPKVAEYLGLSNSTVSKYIKNGKVIVENHPVFGKRYKIVGNTYTKEVKQSPPENAKFLPTEFVSVEEIAEYLDIEKQAVYHRMKIGNVIKKGSIFLLVDEKLRGGWQRGNKRKPLDVTEVSGNTVTNIQVSQA